MPATLDLQMYRGEDRLWTFVPVPGLQATDITGWTLVFKAWNQATPPAAVLTKTVGSGITITTAASGYFTLSLAAADTATLAPGVYPADLWRTDSGNARALANGTLTLRETPSH